MPPSHGRTGRPPRTSRAEILEAARKIIDRDGWERLTMRRLAAELGVGPTTLYHHVRDREDLLIQLLNDHARQTLRPDRPDEPRARIVASATAIHDSLAAWPWAAEVLTTDGFLRRLGRPALAMVESVVGAAVEAGRTPEQAVHLFRAVWYYTVGEILVRAHSGTGRAGDDPDTDGFFDPDEVAELPHLAAIGGRWAVLAARDTYVEGLEALVDGLLSRR